MRVTQSHIARIANVSQATVSRVVAGDARVEPIVAATVRKAIRELDYRPDERARSLRGNSRSGMIGLVVRRPETGLDEDPFFSTFVSHILDFLVKTKYHLCLDVARTVKSQLNVYDELLRTRRVDGLILVESVARDERIRKLEADKFPFVLIGKFADSGRQSSGVLCVDNDNVLAGRLATNHLVQSGYKKIAFLGGPKGVTVSEDRIEGYLEAVTKHQAKPIVVHSEFGYEPARRTATELLSSADRPDALVVLDDFMAMGAVRAAHNNNISIPKDLGVVGFNDSVLCGLVAGGLTSVSMNIPLIVNTACDMLISAIEGDRKVDPTQKIVPCELSIRGSSLGLAN